MKNKDLEKFYDGVYERGEKKHYSKLIFGGKITEEKRAILDEVSWKEKSVLDVGCGTGELAYLMAKKGAKSVLGIDYSYSAIHIAKHEYRLPNLSFEKLDVSDISGHFDVITVVGVLEHIDEPFSLLKWVSTLLRPGGSIMVTCPNWSNARGYILQTLRFLFDARITLVDIHYFTPVEFIVWAKKLKMKMTWKTIEQSWGHGEKLIQDFRKRLPNVLKDLPKSPSSEKINAFIDWIGGHIPSLEGDQKAGGAVGFYHFKKR